MTRLAAAEPGSGEARSSADHAGAKRMTRFLSQYVIFLAAHVLFIGAAIALN